MPFQLTINPHNRLVVIVGTGVTDEAEFRAILLQAVADPAFEAGYHVLVDARALEYTPTTSETHRFVEFHLSHEELRRSKVAVVVTKLVDYGMANMFAILCDLQNAQVRSFRSLEEAEEWLAYFHEP